MRRSADQARMNLSKRHLIAVLAAALAAPTLISGCSPYSTGASTNARSKVPEPGSEDQTAAAANAGGESDGSADGNAAEMADGSPSRSVHAGR